MADPTNEAAPPSSATPDNAESIDAGESQTNNNAVSDEIDKEIVEEAKEDPVNSVQECSKEKGVESEEMSSDSVDGCEPNDRVGSVDGTRERACSETSETIEIR